MASVTGSCNCGSITVSLTAPPSKTVACHWYGILCSLPLIVPMADMCSLNCRRAGGRKEQTQRLVSYEWHWWSIAYSINYVVDETEVKVNDARGTLNEYEDYKTASGNLGRVRPSTLPYRWKMTSLTEGGNSEEFLQSLWKVRFLMVRYCLKDPVLTVNIARFTRSTSPCPENCSSKRHSLMILSKIEWMSFWIARSSGLVECLVECDTTRCCKK